MNETNLKVGARVRVIAAGWHPREGSVIENDGNGEGNMPWWVDLTGDSGATPFNADELEVI